MELLQKIDIKSAGAGQKMVENQPESKADAGLESNNKKPFEDQLNKQIDQIKSKTDSQNKYNNQQDKQVSVSEGQAIDGKYESAEQDEANDAAAVLSGAETLLSSGSLNSERVINANLSITDITLPDTGKILPPSILITATLNQIPESNESLQNSVITVSSKVINQQSIKDIENAVQQKVNRVNTDIVDAASQNTQSLKLEALQAKPNNTAFNVITSFTEKTKSQDAQFDRAMRDIPVSEVLNQSTRLQQVPIITPLSSSVSTAQTLANGILSEVSNTITPNTLNSVTPNNTTPLSNLLNSSITANIQNSNWSQQMTQQVSYMIKGGFQQAEIKLNPAHLGPMEIKLSINDDQASVTFVAQHAPVRDVLDAAIPRLKEMLEQQGLNLADVDVSTQSEQQAHTETQNDQDNDFQGDQSIEKENAISVEQVVIIDTEGESGVSIFA
jgi:flagellar hook-length control protein FliK